jgi:hypothetical protein
VGPPITLEAVIITTVAISRSLGGACSGLTLLHGERRTGRNDISRSETNGTRSGMLSTLTNCSDTRSLELTYNCCTDTLLYCTFTWNLTSHARFLHSKGYLLSTSYIESLDSVPNKYRSCPHPCPNTHGSHENLV